MKPTNRCGFLMEDQCCIAGTTTAIVEETKVVGYFEQISLFAI